MKLFGKTIPVAGSESVDDGGGDERIGAVRSIQLPSFRQMTKIISFPGTNSRFPLPILNSQNRRIMKMLKEMKSLALRR